MSEIAAAVAGGAVALAGVFGTNFTTGRLSRITAARSERLEAYTELLDDLASLRPLLSQLLHQFRPGSDDGLARALREPFTGDDDLRLAAMSAAELVDSALARVRPSLQRVELIGGTPVRAAVAEYLIDLRNTPSVLRSWLVSGVASDPQLSVSLGAYATRDVERVVEAMRRDLASPWLAALHDRSSRRWYHVLWPRPRV